MAASGKIQIDRYLRSGFRFFTPTPTRWGDCDMLGHINNVEYLRYYESGRLDYFHQLLGISAGLEQVDSLILADIHVTFLSQVHHPCALEVGTRIGRLGNSSFDIESAVFVPGEEQPASIASATSVWFDYTRNRSRPIPQAARETIQQFEGIES
ncbi:MAG: thioesterase family protein [Gammaproteobacteria bacterium]|jgi:acyl-CoA thioester hydrolase